MITYWIESPTDNPTVDASYVQLAEDTFDEWEERTGMLQFVGTASPGEADITVYFIPEDPRYPSVIGWCTRSWTPRAELIEGQVEIVLSAAHLAAVYRHELGHCIGLSHSSDSRHIMYPYLTTSNHEISKEEVNLTKLLYILPPGTRPITLRDAYRQRPESGDGYEVRYDPETGVVTEVIPLSLGHQTAF